MSPTSKSETGHKDDTDIILSGNETVPTVEVFEDDDEPVTRAEFEQLCQDIEELRQTLKPVLAYYQNR
jgi:hypothetical protein